MDKSGLRSRGEIVRQLETYVYSYRPWAGKPFFDIRRREVNELLDEVEDRVKGPGGASMADGVLATLRAIMNWYATRDDNYTSPIVRGMRRDKRPAAERARKRILADDEIRAVWKAAEHRRTIWRDRQATALNRPAPRQGGLDEAGRHRG